MYNEVLDVNLKRKIYDDLILWKEKYSKKYALLVEGARRIGKSTICEKFAKENYKSYILIDFARASKDIKENFHNNLNNLDVFYQNIMLEYNTKLYQGESILIFDEVQVFPRAREVIKYLVADGRYSFIETGSLISIKENVENILIPSEEHKIKMYPLDFEEFLWAAGEEVFAEYIKECANKKIPLQDKNHNRAMRLFKEYILVGGMPQSVVAYFENNRDFESADVAKREILALYKDDIKKSSKKYNLKVSALFDNISGFLLKHDKKIVLSEFGRNNTYSNFSDHLFWIDDSMICNLCYKCNDPNVGFALNKDDSSVKCYMGDTGLLVSHTFSENELASNNLYLNIIKGKLSINEGMFYENVIAQMIVSKGKKLYFYTHYNEVLHRNDIKIDFMITNDSITNLKVYPIEVKSAKNYTTVSYDKFKAKFGKRISNSFIVHPKQLVVDETGVKVPPYMFFFMI